MIVVSGTNSKIEKYKSIHGLKGDVYIIKPGNLIETLESHKVLFPDSTATTLEEAEAYHVQYLADLAEARAKAAAEQALDEDLS